MIQLGKPRRRYPGYIHRAQCAKPPRRSLDPAANTSIATKASRVRDCSKLALHHLARCPRWRRRPRAR